MLWLAQSSRELYLQGGLLELLGTDSALAPVGGWDGTAQDCPRLSLPPSIANLSGSMTHRASQPGGAGTSAACNSRS